MYFHTFEQIHLKYHENREHPRPKNKCSVCHNTFNSQSRASLRRIQAITDRFICVSDEYFGDPSVIISVNFSNLYSISIENSDSLSEMSRSFYLGADCTCFWAARCDYSAGDLPKTVGAGRAFSHAMAHLDPQFTWFPCKLSLTNAKDPGHSCEWDSFFNDKKEPGKESDR